MQRADGRADSVTKVAIESWKSEALDPRRTQQEHLRAIEALASDFDDNPEAISALFEIGRTLQWKEKREIALHYARNLYGLSKIKTQGI